MTSAITRWANFLAQLEGRHREVILEAEAWARQFFSRDAAGDGDTSPLSHYLMSVSSRLSDLETKIIDTWHAQVEDAVFAEGGSVVDRDREYALGQALQWALSDQREELEPRLFAELARQRYARALVLARNLTCRQCGTAPQVPVTFRPMELPCVACGARILFEPDAMMRSVAAIGAHPLAHEAALWQWRAVRATERRAHNIRPPRPLEVVFDLERTQIAYWQTYLAVRAQFDPEMGRDPLMEIRSRMQAWYVSHAEYEPAWVAAGRPRSI